VGGGFATPAKSILYRLSTAQRTIGVIMRRLAPGAARRWASHDALTWWTAPFVVAAQHAKWGADLLTQIGSDSETIWLVRYHQSDEGRWSAAPSAGLMRRLQRADNNN
jgi:hypothetical protein